MHFQPCERIAEIEPEAWDALVADDEPFARHAFLASLEASGSVGAGTGWLPCHLVAYAGDTLCAALLLYQKDDSFGEFIFDWAWAQASAQAGIPYYPKLVSAIPFTPASGPRLLTRAPHTPEQVMAPLCHALEALQRQRRASGVHILFCSQQEQEQWQGHGFASRLSQQFHWRRAPHWTSFDDYLADLRTASRKQVRKERERARGHGLALSMEAASSLSQTDLQAVYRLYRQTVWEKGAQAYLTAPFFEALAGPLGQLSHLALARRDGAICAMALFFHRGSSLFGRYWGALEQWDALHFELCYYLPMQWAIERGIDRFEAGAQGEHKLKRGFLPSHCFSAHALAHPGLAQAVRQFVAQEASHVNAQMQMYAAHKPYKRNESSPAQDRTVGAQSE